MKDFSGHDGAVLVRRRPLNGGWCLLRFHNQSKAVALVEMGAYAGRDGGICAIFCEQTTTPPVVVSGAAEGGKLIPAYYAVVTPNGHNLLTAVTDRATGHVSVLPVIFYADSPSIMDAADVESVADLPPGRVFDTRFLEAMHGKPLGDEFHQAKREGLRPFEARPMQMT